MSNESIQSTFTERLQKLLHKYIKNLDSQYTFCKNMHEVAMNNMEKALLLTVLKHTNNSRSKSAEILGINRSTLSRKIKKYGIS